MRTLPVVLVLLALTACTVEDDPSAVQVPTGPCAAARVQPPDGSDEQRLQADLDGDGRSDEVVAWLDGGARVVQAWLADGQNAVPEKLLSGLLAAKDLDADGRAEVVGQVPQVVAQGGLKSEELRAGVFALDGCRLSRVTVGDAPLEVVYGAGTARLTTLATARCRPGGIEQVISRDAPQPGVRLVETTRWTVQGGTAQTAGTTSVRVPEKQDPVAATQGTLVCP